MDNHGRYASASSLVVGEKAHVAVVYTPTSDQSVEPVLYINGEVVASTSKGGSFDTGILTDAGQDLTIGNDDNDNNPFNGLIADARFYDSILSSADIYEIYKQGARARTAEHPRFAWPESCSAKGIGDTVGPYIVTSDASYKWVDNGDTRGLECLTAGTAVCQQKEAFGGWYFKIKHDSAAATDVYFINSSQTISTGGGNGYRLRLSTSNGVYIYRITAATAVVIASSVASLADGVEYEFLLLRSTAQGWSFWARGGGWSVWTEIDTATDNTYTSSAFMVVDMDAGDARISSYKHVVGGSVEDPRDLGF